MSEITEKIDENEQIVQAQDFVEGLKKFFSTLVPPTSVVINDIFGTEYDLICSISARNQVKILREFDKIDIESNASINLEDGNALENIVQSIISVATDDKSLLVICRCFEFGHPNALNKAKTIANDKGYVFEDSDYAPADLFSLEELATAIVPLFIRLAKRTSQAVQSLIK